MTGSCTGFQRSRQHSARIPGLTQMSIFLELGIASKPCLVEKQREGVPSSELHREGGLGDVINNNQSIRPLLSPPGCIGLAFTRLEMCVVG